jgi:hypothetical protein
LRRSLVDVLAPAAFVAGLAALAYGWGFVTAERRLPPRDTLAAMGEAAKGVWAAYLRPEARAAGDYVQTVPAPAEPFAVHDRARAAEGLTLVVGYRPEGGFGARLVDLDGRVRHEWRARFSEVFPEPRHLLWKAPDAAVAWHGVRLFPNGDLVFNFHGNSFPYGGGLVRLDKDSRVLWACRGTPTTTSWLTPTTAAPRSGCPDMRYRPRPARGPGPEALVLRGHPAPRVRGRRQRSWARSRRSRGSPPACPACSRPTTRTTSGSSRATRCT